jgi:hypothetical protein
MTYVGIDEERSDVINLAEHVEGQHLIVKQVGQSASIVEAYRSVRVQKKKAYS